MKKLFIYVLLAVGSFSGFAQQFEINLLPDSLTLRYGREFCSVGNSIHAIVQGSTAYHYLRIENDSYDFIDNVPYELATYRTYGMELYDGNCYHLTRQEGVRIYQENGTWDSITVNNGLHSGYVQGLLKDEDKLYIITKDTLNYFDGANWSYFPLNTDNDYVKMVKYDNKVFFNINEMNASLGGIYVFDGVNLELLINRSIYSYEITDGEIWISSSSYNQGLEVYDISGNQLPLDLSYTVNAHRTVMVNTNDTLYVLANNYNGPVGFCIQDREVLQSQKNFSHTYQDCQKTNTYKNGILVKSSDNKLIHIKPSLFNSFGTLQIGKTYRNLDINQVDAYYMHRGQMFWDGVGQAKYEVPKGSGKTSMFAGGLWVTAKDIHENIYAAVSKFNTNGYDFFPGPLRASGVSQGTTDSVYAQNFDHIWKITREEILLHQLLYQSNDYTIPEDIATWPAHGNVSDGYAADLAPYIDYDNNGMYEPENGDYPDIKGDMSLYWIFNDRLAEHTESEGSNPLGIEIHAQAYAYNCDTLMGIDSVINYTTFLDYRIINRGLYLYQDLNTAFWTDADMGYAFDDYIGTHVGLNSMYIYNGDDMDGIGTGNEYGENPPAQFVTILDAPLAIENDGVDNDNDGTIDEVDEKALLDRMVYFNNNTSANGDPVTAEHYFNYMHGFWKDDRSMVFGGTGYQPSGGIPSKYMFPGESDPWLNGTYGVDPNYTTPGGWTEENENNDPSDRRGLASTGAIDLPSGEDVEFTIAYVWSRGDNGAFSSVTKGFGDVARVIEMYNNGELHGCGLENVSVKEKHDHKQMEIYPNPVSESFVIKGVNKTVDYQVMDIKGRILQAGKYTGESIQLNKLSAGTYVLKVISKEDIQTRKLVKVH